MSQASDAETNGPMPTDVGPRQGSYEGVKVALGGNSPPLTTLQTPQISSLQQNQPLQNFPQRPPQPIRRTDSRNSISYRPPFPNQVPVQQPIGAGIRPPPQQLQQRPPPPGANFVTQRPVQRFSGPGPQQQPQPIRYQYDPQQDGNFRRAVNTVFQRPPSAGPRAPGIYQQKSLPQQQTVVPDPIKKSYTLDNSEVMAHSTTEENGTKKNDIVSTPEKSKYDELRSSSSLGFNQDTNGEKDIDTTLNGKSFVKEEIPERPESRTGLLSRDHSLHSSMQKIDEDDDDAVITPSRTFASGSIRSGKSSISNSSDNISQKSLDLNKPDITKSPVSPEIRKETKLAATPQKRNSTDNIMQKSLDIESSNNRASTPLPPESPEIKKASPLHTPIPPTRIIPDLKPMNLTTQEKVSRTPSPLPPMKQETPKSMTPESRPISGGIKSQVVVPTSPVPNKDPVISSPSPRSITPNVKKSASPRVESKSIVNGRRTPTSKIRKEGDNDSGVDESTQGNDRSLNGEQASPKKTPSKLSKVPTNKCKTPTKMLHSPKSPDPANSLNTSTDKKVPMNKVQVGAAPSPNIKQVKSKIGSLDNANYKPGGGKIKVENRKVDFSKVQPKIAAKNDQYTPGGGDKKSRIYSASRPSNANNWDEIQQQKLQWNAKSKIGSLDNSTYKPGGGDKKIESVKLDFKDKAKPKVGSKDNIKHTPGGGDVKSIEDEQQQEIETKKIELNVSSKVGSMDNVKHKPGGGDVKIFDDKEYLRQKTSGEQSVLSGSQSSLRSQPEPAEPVSDENLNQER